MATHRDGSGLLSNVFHSSTKECYYNAMRTLFEALLQHTHLLWLLGQTR